MVKETFGVRLRTLRETAGLSQGELAKRTGLALSAVQKLEQGLRSPTWTTVQSLCRCLGVGCQAFESHPRPDENAGAWVRVLDLSRDLVEALEAALASSSEGKRSARGSRGSRS